MFKTFVAGIFIGIIGCGALLYVWPRVDHHRETSIVSVAPNGLNTEEFHIKVPMDRILIGASGQQNTVPRGLEWPSTGPLAGVRAELFKFRNKKDVVIGVASRLAVADAENGDTIEWVLHLPARGSLYVTMRPESAEAGYRSGTLRAGTREFESFTGGMSERWIGDFRDPARSPEGRIELVAAYFGPKSGLQ